MTAMTMLSEIANHNSPQRVATTVAQPRNSPTIPPDPKTMGRCALAFANAGRICGGPGPGTANADTAVRKKHAAVVAATAGTIGTTTRPGRVWNGPPGERGTLTG